MNFTKFFVSVGKNYYKSFEQWYTCNPRTVGQFLHPVELAIVGSTPTTDAQFSVHVERTTRAGVVEPLPRDHFCCFLAEKSNAAELNYGEHNSSPSSALRWQRTTVSVQVPGRIAVQTFLTSLSFSLTELYLFFHSVSLVFGQPAAVYRSDSSSQQLRPQKRYADAEESRPFTHYSCRPP